MDNRISAFRPGEPSAEDILAALKAILSHDELRLSERNRRFLSFVVDQTVAGHSERIKAYTIGVDVFGRDEAFDPTLDPIVRIEATRLRSALTAYYDATGARDRIRIAIPPGSYVPTFAWAESSAEDEADMQPAGVQANKLAHAETIVVHDQSPQSDAEAALRGELFADALVRLLSQAQFKVHVVPSVERRAALDAIRELFSHPCEAYSLDLAVRPMLERRRYSWRFGDLRNGQVLSSDFRDYVISATPCFDLIDAVAEEAAQAVRGALPRHEAVEPAHPSDRHAKRQ